MTTITLELPDELASRLHPLRNHFSVVQTLCRYLAADAGRMRCDNRSKDSATGSEDKRRHWPAVAAIRQANVGEWFDVGAYHQSLPFG